MRETKIYVGLNDADTLVQEHDSELYVTVLKHVCLNYQVPFTFHLTHGGYMHENGQYTQEQTLEISLLNVDTEIVHEVARDLCVFFHQESVMITQGEIEAYFISENI